MYIERKPIAQRTPIPRKDSISSVPSKDGDMTSEGESVVTTPAATEGSTASSASEVDSHTESESGTETEGEGPRNDLRHATMPVLKTQATRPKSRSPRLLSRVLPSEKKTHHRAESQYDLLNKYFRRDTVLLHNIDLLR
jgi:phosphatidylethanolamine N-methyltransferase